MVLDFIIAALIARYLRRTLETAQLLPQWDKILLGIFGGSIVLLAMSILAKQTQVPLGWVAHAVLLYILYVLYTNQKFRAARPYMLAIFPYTVISIAADIIKTFFNSFYNKWDKTAETAIFFAIVWLVAMLIINKRQQKALLKEKQKTKEEEEQNKIMVKVKAELEVQVAERTAEITLQKEELQEALDELRATQTQLIHSEKMASLGELTAGIAHEIQNPLNFVNNFSELNAELIAEMKQEIDKGNMEEVRSIARDIAENEQKIHHHGQRAGAIVKGMLQHSRTGSGQKELTDINALADEYVRLAYHGLRAKDKSFNAKFETDFDNSIGELNIIPQDVGRVILNLINNAFYAVSEKQKQDAQGYDPTVRITTKRLADKVEIHVSDNGNGVPQKVLDKIFQPFFTTKPTGQGTGLGLSLSYDIITKGHDGQLKVKTREGEGSEFIIRLPLKD